VVIETVGLDDDVLTAEAIGTAALKLLAQQQLLR